MEPSKLVDGAVAFLRGFPLAVRMVVSACLVVPLIVVLHGRYDWPHWPVHNSVGLNVIALVFLVAAFFTLISFSPRPGMSVAELPETKPVFSDSLRYFKTGPELKGMRGELLKRLQNAYETAAASNKYLLPAEKMMDCQTSQWEFDRIAFYLFERYTARPAPADRIQRVNYEVALLDTRGWTGTLVPLHYAVESVYPGSFEQNPAPTLSPSQLEPFRKILIALDSWPARLRRPVKGARGKAIIMNCRRLLKESSGIATLAAHA